MMSIRKKIFVTVAIGAVVVIGAMGAYVHHIMSFSDDMARELAQAETRRLCETDHQALLEACRELSRQVKAGELKDGVYGPPEVLRFPEPIPTLQPKFVTIGRDGPVLVEMGFGLWPLGVYAYPEDFPQHPPPFKYGDRKLLEGLWYYEDGYSLDPNAYDKRIDRLLSRNKKLKRAVPKSNVRSSWMLGAMPALAQACSCP